MLPGSRSHFNAIAAGPGGAVHAGGTIVSRTRLRLSPSSFVALGLDRDGRRLRGFGREGILTTAFGRASSGARETVIDTRGRLVLAGGLETPALPDGEGLALARYRVGR